MNLSSFIKESCTPLFEGIRSRDIEKGIQLISSYLKKRKIYTIPNIFPLEIDGRRKLCVLCWNDKAEGACFVWDLAESAQVETVMFTKNFDDAYASWFFGGDNFVWDVYVEAKGANAVQMCKLVESVLTGKVPMTSDKIRAEIADAQLFEEHDSEEDPINEAVDPAIKALTKKRESLRASIKWEMKKGRDVSDLQAQYDEIVKEIADARLSVRSNVSTKSAKDEELEIQQTYFEEEVRATPEERFDDMKSYIYNVVTGIRPLALLCGAPGVGKTFRVKQIVKGTGLKQSQDTLTGDWLLLKGKSTPSNLYTALFNFKEKGQLIVFDDCDSIFKDDDAINLLKAAYDSDDERYVSWGTSTKIPYPDQDMAPTVDGLEFDSIKGKWYYPKQFLYEGGGIVITNYRAGQIDTAVRNRALICDLDFTADEILNLIESIAPKIMPGILSQNSKEQAMEYLRELAGKGAPVELSIRSFTLCAGLFNSDAPVAAIKRRIAEQMKNQSARGGKKY